MKYRAKFNEDGRLNEPMIKDALRYMRSREDFFEIMHRYYTGDNPEIQRSSRGVNRQPVIIPYGRKIINTVTGYMFKSGYIGYSTENEDYKAFIDDVFYQNDEDELTSELGKNCSINGVAYELHYLNADENGSVSLRFTEVPVMEMLAIYGEELTSEGMKAAIRYYCVDDTRYVDIYYPDAVVSYRSTEAGNLSFIDEVPHEYGMVPVVEYINNEEQIGDFTPVIKLIDAYDILISDAVSEIEKLADAYLVLVNMSMSEDDARNLKRKRILELAEGGKAEFLTKNISPELLKFMRDWIKEEIHSQSHIPDMSDDHFAGQQSGVAIRYKMNDLENICSTKEIYFRKGLYRRLELIDRVSGILGADSGIAAEVQITFTRNIPMNYLEIAQIVQHLRGNVSLQTLLEQVVPFVTSAQEEIDKLKEEEDVYGFDWEDTVDTGKDDSPE